ncbi:hypothetical protein ALMP_40070 [Streptomyces sp. A012304]|nr:hypothetical protein ALMP_40070 [Streptomyces sp. A012304]
MGHYGDRGRGVVQNRMGHRPEAHTERRTVHPAADHHESGLRGGLLSTTPEGRARSTVWATGTCGYFSRHGVRAADSAFSA